MNDPLRLLLSRAAVAQWGDAIRAVLADRPHRFVALDSPQAQAGVDIAFISRDVTGASTRQVDTPILQACHAVLRASPALRWVHTHAAGADRPLYGELHARGTQVTTSSGANASVVAQTALGGLLALAREFPRQFAAQRERRWQSLVSGPLPRDLAGQTVVLVGWGPIARQLAALLTALGLRLVVVRQRAQPAGEGIETVPFDALHRVLPRADWLVLACPLNATTRHLLDARALALLPAHARLVNVARGELADEPALVDALQQRRLAGAFLDVFEHEPLPAESPLWGLENVIVTPHSGGHSDGNAGRVAAIFVDNLRRWLDGQALCNAMAP